MKMIFLYMAILTLMGITLQDFRQRLILWYLFPLAAISLFFYQYFDPRSEWDWKLVVINLTTVGLMISSIFLFYHSKKNLRLQRFTDCFGTGDFLMLIIPSFIFSPIDFIIFLLTCFSASLLYWVFTVLIRRKESFSIPLAGIISLGLLVIIFIHEINPLFHNRLAVIDLISNA